jgi:predicted dinucleotide-binding enzyme
MDPSKVFSGPEAIAKLKGKVIVDLNNRSYLDDVLADGGRWFDKSLGETLQENLPDSHVVKAFNTIAMGVLDTSKDSLKDSGAQIFVAGNDDKARKIVSELSDSLGLEAVDLGPGKVAMKAAEALGDVVRYFILERKWGGRANIGMRKLGAPDLNLVGPHIQSGYTR